MGTKEYNTESDGERIQLNPISILMVGPTRVGKTSMLASMYQQIRAKYGNGNSANYSMHVAPGPTKGRIVSQQEKLELLGKASGMVIDDKHNILGNTDFVKNEFNLTINRKYTIPLNFIDVPGAVYTGEMNLQDENGQNVENLLNDSHISLLTVDAVALMESNGKHHQRFNRPRFIEELYHSAEFAHDHQVILVLIRAETYVRDKRIEELKARAREEYTAIAESIRSNPRAKGMGFKGCYILTVGGLFFNRYHSTEGETDVTPVFERNTDIGYRPQGCDIPLRMVAAHGLKKAVDEAIIEKEGDWFRRLLELFGIETAISRAREKHKVLYDALKDLDDGLKKENTF